MPERGFMTDTWTEPWFQKLNERQRYLFIYLWTNNHCNQAGVYQITLATIAFETRLSEEELPELLESLAPKAMWYPEPSIVWVRNFLKHQSKSPKFLVAAAKCLHGIHNNGLVDDVIKYNFDKYSISIPYQYTTDSVLIPSVPVPSAVPCTSTVPRGKGVRGEGESKNKYKTGRYGHMVQG